METSDVSLPIKTGKYYVYILYSYKDCGLYIGYTANLKLRLSAHADNRVSSTKYRSPFLLIHYEYFINQSDAKSRERFLKSGYGRDQIRAFLKSTLIPY